MIRSTDLLEFAADFHDSDDETRRRAAASRAYYAAFHHLRDIAEERVGLPRFGTTDDHADLHAALLEIDMDIARDFRFLRTLRVIADYELNRAISVADAMDAYASAARVLTFD